MILAALFSFSETSPEFGIIHPGTVGVGTEDINIHFH